MKKIFVLTGSLFIYLISNAQSFTEILGRPTDNSITISVLFDQKVDLFIEYSTQSGIYPNSSANITNVAHVPDEIDLQNLIPDTKYYYRTRYKSSGTSSSFLAGVEHTFHTQRTSGSTFTFTIESDEHLYDKKGVRSIYQICLENQLKDNPDFMFSLGDTYGDDHNPTTITSDQSKDLHYDYRQYFGKICHSVPFFFCLGNHEGEKDYYLHQNPPDNMAVYATLWRKFYYPNPYPNAFYSGNTETEDFGIGLPENYYAFTWGDALFIVLDVYRYDSETSAKPGGWDWTLGQAQYDWLKSTLESNKSKYKFVFAHHVSGEGRGGINQAKLFEWGGYDQKGTYAFPDKRPDMDKPIHKLFVDNGVNIFFQGHDHLFAREEMDGVTYQEVPMPSDSTYEIGMLANADAYVSDTIGGTGHVRVTVSPSCVRVDFIRAYLPADTLSGVHHNGELAFTYNIGDCAITGANEPDKNDLIKVFPNPAIDFLVVRLFDNTMPYQISLITTLGQTILQTQSENIDIRGIQNGIYFLNIRTAKHEGYKKIIVCR